MESALWILKFKALKIDFKLLSQKLNLQTLDKKHKNPFLISNPTPPMHILKHTIKITFSTPWSRILINFEIVHLTPLLVMTWFWEFLAFETLKWSFRTQNLKPKTIKLKVLKMVQTPTPQTQIPKRLTKQTNYSDNLPSFL